MTTYGVNRRQAEIGIRLALGATPGRVMRAVLSRVTRLVTVGVLLGAGLSLWVSQFITTLLFGIEPHDDITLLGAAVLLMVVGAIAGWLPAYRAVRLDLVAVLREN